ncbi:hypothetical protein ACHHYP_01252 [Achlya hypogyna]|uniref:RRM domain-containing protein n=1 Tax=Achlya hypogyna TaxID=1202772 RepID=A0A1V9Z908_ACHHY|nr:hypothetical protein ACHHYP_01252 [Achlya hypogyna]
MATPADPSRVLYVDNLAANVTDAQLEQLFSQFGVVDRIVLLRKKHSSGARAKHNALVQMECLPDAIVAHDTIRENPPTLADDLTVVVTYSKNQELRGPDASSPKVRPVSKSVDAKPRETTRAARVASTAQDKKPRTSTGGNREPKATKARTSSISHADEAVNRILLVTVQNPMYPITTDLIGKIFSVYGTVEKVVIFVKPVGLQCLVQFTKQEDAVTAKEKLDAEAIYPDSCFMVIHYSNLPELVVKENSLKTRDFTNPTLPVPVMDTAINALHTTIALPFIPPSATGEILDASRGSLGMPQNTHGDTRGPSSPVLLVCNLHPSLSCDQLFNLFSCYGNITRVKKLHAKPDHALIQFVNETAASSALTHLRGFLLEGKSLEIQYSKHKAISARQDQPDNDYSMEYPNSCNRFTGKYAHYTKHIYSPTKVLHLSNLSADLDTDLLRAHLSAFGRVDRAKLKVFHNSKGHPQVLAELGSIDAATNLLAAAHNSDFNGKLLKIAFSRSNTHH